MLSTHTKRVSALMSFCVFGIQCSTSDEIHHPEQRVADPSAEITTQSDDTLNPLLKAPILSEHPRILFNSSQWSDIKSRLIRPSQIEERWLKVLVDAADYAMTLPLIDRNADDFLIESRKALGRLTLWAGLYRLLNNKEYLNKAKELMFHIAELGGSSEKAWNPNDHFLDPSELSTSMSIAYDWLYNDLTPTERQKIGYAIVYKGLKPGLKKGWWQTDPYNWNLVTNSSMMMAALSVWELNNASLPVPENRWKEARSIINNTISSTSNNIKIALDTYGNGSSVQTSGGWPEGASYWEYATRYAVWFISSLQSAYGDDFGFLETPGLDQTGWYRIATLTPRQKIYNFGDADDKFRPAGFMFWLGSQYDQMDFIVHERDAIQKVLDDDAEISNAFHESPPDKACKASIFHLLWLTPALAPPITSRAKVFTNQDLDLATFHHEDLYIGLKGGTTRGGNAHAQVDLGSIILESSGTRWIVDLGRAYDDAEHHSTLSIDGIVQDSEDGVAKLQNWQVDNTEWFAVMNLTNAYGKKEHRPAQIKRGIYLDKTDRYAVLRDEIELDKRREVRSGLMIDKRVKIKLNPSKTVASLSKNGTSVKIHIKEPTGQFDIEEGRDYKKLSVSTKQKSAILVLIFQLGSSLPSNIPFADLQLSSW